MSANYCTMGQFRCSITSERQVAGIVISKSVGAGGANLRDDAVLIQKMLNAVQSISLGSNPLLKIDGLVGPLTIRSIAKFQQANLGWSDGRVDPGGRTLDRLNVLVPPTILQRLASSPR